MQIAGAPPATGWWSKLVKWWKRDPAVIQRATAARAKTIAAVTAESARKQTGLTEIQAKTVADKIENLLIELSEGRATLKPNQWQIAAAKEEMKNA